MKNLFDTIAHSLHKLNQTLISIENEIVRLADEENKIMKKKLCNKTNDIHDYELKVLIEFYSDEEQILEIEENLKHPLGNTKITNIGNHQNHNTTSCCWDNKTLNSQHHCWLFHTLYDDYFLSWQEILSINSIWYNLKIEHQYKVDL